jgi:hypothetical protein
MKDADAWFYKAHPAPFSRQFIQTVRVDSVSQTHLLRITSIPRSGATTKRESTLIMTLGARYMRQSRRRSALTLINDWTILPSPFGSEYT